MKAKGAKDGAKAASIANAILADCRARNGSRCEEIAIRTALARVNAGSKEQGE